MPSAHRPPPAPSGSPARRPRGPSWRPSATRPARLSSGSRRRWAAPSTSPGRGASRRLTPRRAGPGGAPAIGHVPSDGWLEPSKVAVGLTGRAAELGARILPFTRVTGIRRDGHCVAGVATTRGDVATPTVVDAAGGWTRVVPGGGTGGPPGHRAPPALHHRADRGSAAAPADRSVSSSRPSTCATPMAGSCSGATRTIPESSSRNRSHRSSRWPTWRSTSAFSVA